MKAIHGGKAKTDKIDAIVGAEPVGRQTVKVNGSVGSYTGASQLLRRKGKEAVRNWSKITFPIRC
jgi:hypothetical protein